MKTRIFLILALALTTFQQALADQIRLKNGDQLSGQIIKSDGKTLTLKTDYAGVIGVSVDSIDQISSDQQLYVALSDGRTVAGTISTKAGKVEVSTKDSRQVAVEQSAVAAIRSAPEEAAYRRLQNPGWFDLWSGGVDLGFSLTTGNTQTTSLALGAAASRETRHDRTNLYAAVVNAKNKVNGITDTTANAIRGGGRYEVNLTNRLSAFGFADFEHNGIQLLDIRAVFGGGLGYYVIKSDRTQLQAFGGGSYNHEKYSTGVTRNSGEALVGEDLAFKLSKRTFLKERLQFFPNLSDTGNYRITFDSSLVTKLNNWLNWQVTLSDRYLSNPVPGSKNNDLLFTTGLGITFKNHNFK